MYKNEKRKFIRLNLTVDVVCKIYSEKKESLKFLSKDISIGGIRILLDKKLFLGNILELQLYLSHISEPIIVLGEVVWQNYTKINEKDFYETGVKFTKISWYDQEKIKETMFETIGEILKHLDRLHIEKENSKRKGV